MPTLVKILKQYNEGPQFKKVLIEFNGPASYPNTGSTIGDPITAASIGLSSIAFVDLIPGAVNSSGVVARRVFAVLPLATPGATNAGGPEGFPSFKVTWHDLDGTQIADTTDESAYRARAIITGNPA